MFDFSIWTNWIDQFLRTNLPEFWALAIEFVVVGVIILALYCIIALALIYFERKICAFFQCRLGPNRVGPYGIFQSVADMLKMLIKEIIPINHTDKFLFYLAPFFVLIASILAFGAIPWGNGLQILDFNIGIFYILSVSSLGVIGILLAGWASNNKYSMIGAMRSGAQLISYELMTIVVLSGSMQLSTMIEGQKNCWYLFQGHIPAVIAFIIYLIAGHAETNRGPFDLPEAESELAAGYHTEYSGLQFGFFYLAEYLNMFIIASIAATVFLGGWMPFHVTG
ncbi:MAG: complex I subunit 1 family protein, partial [Bacteroidales bacterium]